MLPAVVTIERFDQQRIILFIFFKEKTTKTKKKLLCCVTTNVGVYRPGKYKGHIQTPLSRLHLAGGRFEPGTSWLQVACYTTELYSCPYYLTTLLCMQSAWWCLVMTLLVYLILCKRCFTGCQASVEIYNWKKNFFLSVKDILIYLIRSNCSYIMASSTRSE